MRPSNKRLLRRFSERQFHIYSFFIPVFVMTAIFAILQVHPFASGENMILTVDCYHQYAPFLLELRNKILGGESLFFSWNVGLGTNFWAVFANYSASPLNILCIFFPAKYIGDCVALLAILRCGLTGLFMSYLLKELDKDRKDLLLTSFASIYALCGWTISYFWNIMWHDAVMLLPLIVLGLIKMFRDKKPLLYCISLAVCLISNFYSGYFVCLFLVFYAPILYISITKRITIQNFWSAVWRFGLYSLISGGLSAFLTVSTYFTLQKSSATGTAFPKEFAVQNDLFDFISRFFIGQNPNIRDGMANVYSGLFVLILIPLFFLCSKIRLREKIAYGVGLSIMYISLSSRMMTFIWHGFHFPNQIPYRESFLMSFLLVFIGFLTIRRIRSLGVKYITGAVLSSAAFLVLYEKFGMGNEGYLQIGVTLLFLIIQGAALHTVSNINVRKSEFFLETLLTVTMMFEMFAASLISIGLVAKHEGFTSYSPYGRNYRDVASYVNEVEGSEGHMNFERSELYPNNICDLQSLYNVKGLSIFSSTARESFVKYMRNYGFHNNNINGLRNAGLTRVTATLLNVRNLVEIDKTQSVPSLFEQEYKGKIVSSWANKDALSVGFMTDPGVIDYAPDYDKDLDVFDKTNAWVRSMGAENVYKPVTLITGETSGLNTLDRESQVLAFTVSNNVPNNEYSFNVTIEDADIGSDIYLYANSKKGGSVTVECGDTTRKFEIRSYQIITCGVFDGTPIHVYVKYSESPSSNITLYGYQLDRAGYDNMLEKFSDEQLNITKYDTTSIEGHIDVKEDGLLFLSIPYAEGWRAVVDGKDTEIVPIQDALMGIRLSQGSHDVALKYTPAGFKAGLLISAASVVMIVCVIVVSSFISKKKNSKIQEAQTTAVNTSAASVQEGSIEAVNNMPAEAIEEVPVAAVIADADEPAKSHEESENDAGEGGTPEVPND